MIVKRDRIMHSEFGRLLDFVRSGDLLVVNTSSTLPSSFFGRVLEQNVELRLASFRGANASELNRWAAVLFGEGDWRTPTEHRQAPPRLRAGEVIEIEDDLSAVVTAVDPNFPRLLEIEFRSEHLVQRLYTYGRPIQYSYLEETLKVWDQQTIFGGPPVSVEPPSAAFSLTWAQVLELKRIGVEVATILHSAGISSSGDEKIDQLFPLAEYFEVPAATKRRIEAAKTRGSRVIAFGTTVTRALESAFANGFVAHGYTTLRLGSDTKLRVVDALITGMHADGTSHFELMKAFCGCDMLKRADDEAEREGYRSHEFGDLALLSCR
jgi:S-adenosylmethionine:tRNA ribosyltransferase-isomerase